MSGQKRHMIFLLIAFMLPCVFTLPSDVLSAPYYEGKVIKVVVGNPVGGTYDRIARLLSKHLPKHIPGKPIFIIDNMDGAGGIVAANYIYSVAKPNGLTIGAIGRGLPFAQLTKVTGVKFDLSKFSWIGSAATEALVLAIRTDLPYKTFDDLLKAKSPIMLASTGPAESSSQFSTLLKEFLGLNLKFVIYPGSSAGMLAVERKEVDGRPGAYSSLKPFIDRGLLRPVIRGRVSEPGIEHLPIDEILATDNKAKTIMALRSTPDLVGRPYVAPPGTSIELMNILKKAFIKVYEDPEFKEDSRKYGLDLEYIPAEECFKQINYVLNQPEEIVKEFSKYIKF